MFLFCKGNNRVIAKKSLIPVSYYLIVHPRAITAEVLDVDEILILKKYNWKKSNEPRVELWAFHSQPWLMCSEGEIVS